MKKENKLNEKKLKQKENMKDKIISNKEKDKSTKNNNNE